MSKKYYLGLDIGTNSVGYAVTDENYNLIKLKGKKAWGVRLFDEASTAVDRRTKRTNRRRLDRRKLRLKWLQEIFESEISKVDKQFLSRIKYSNLYLEDKVYMDNQLKSKDSLFFGEIDGKNYTDKEFHAEYPTIHHLRQELTQKPAKDVRFLYLALHNIVKRRGHFLYDGDYGENSNFCLFFNEFIIFLKTLSSEEVLPIAFSPISESKEKEDEILNSLREIKSVRDRKTKFYEIFNVQDKTSKKFIDIILEGKGSTHDIFPPQEEVEKFSFNDENFDSEIYQKLENILSEEQMSIIDNLKKLYSCLQLKKILGNDNYISDAMVNIFKTHEQQLKNFKKFIKSFYPSKYYDMFRNPLNVKNPLTNKKESFSNYALYVNSTNFNGKGKVKNVGLGSSEKGTKEAFYKYVKSILNNQPENTLDNENFENSKSEILTLIENDNFLPKIRTKSNAVFPNKLYEKEVKKILEVNSSKFQFLSQKDETGLTNAEKIMQILSFRIPYFVGPIGINKNDETTHSWAEREMNLPLRPWTLSKIVDFDKAEERFIERMINKCTYLKESDVLPKHSILYSKFRVLNELNKLKINGDNINVKLKQSIFNNLFKENKKVSEKMLKNYLVNEGLYSKDEKESIQLSGIDNGKFANDFSSYHTLKQILGSEFIDKNIDIVEKIIKYITIINDKKRLEKRLKREFGTIIDETKIKQIKNLNFADWGRLSKDFLLLPFENESNGEKTTIIDEMWNTNQNLQEILFNKSYTIGAKLDEINSKNIKQLKYDAVEELYCSPAVKRAVWQAISIVNEITKLAGEKPERIFVEVTRHDEEKGEKGRKSSRKSNLLKEYESKEFNDNIETFGIDLCNLLKELNKKDDQSFRNEKLYLYFLQLGKCAYSGEPISLEEINNNELYDVDHIIPQAIVKDDSINNKVLVKKNYNGDKGDIYPISTKFDWPDKMNSFWKILVEKKLMSKEKYSRLIRKEPLTNGEIGNFIARQIVETNQSAKAVIDLLKMVVDNPRNIIYSKAQHVSNFRHDYDIPKCREINDLHHAKDAYLNIVVGNVLFNRFTDDPRNFYKKDKFNNKLTKNIGKIFNETIKNYENDNVIWSGEKDITRIKKIVSKNDCVVSRMSYSETNGAFYNETIYKSKQNNPNTDAKISLKGNIENPLHNLEKYGGYDSMSTAYFMLVESEDKKHNKIKTIETVPIYALRTFKSSPNKEQQIFDYVVKKNNLHNARILIDKINIKSTIKIGNGEYWLAGKSNENFILHNANQWFLPHKEEKYVKAIMKYMDMKRSKKTSNLAEENGKVVLSPKSKEGNIEIALTREDNINLYNSIISQLNKSLYQLNLVKIKDILIDKKENFNALSVMEQAEQLNNIIGRMSTGATSCDLSLIGGSKSAGVITINKNIDKLNILLIKRSVTGLIESYIKL